MLGNALRCIPKLFSCSFMQFNPKMENLTMKETEFSED